MTTKSPRRAFAALLVAALATAACGGSDDETTTKKSGGSPTEASAAGQSSSSGNEVLMKLIAYKPDALTVPVGTNVTWKQTDAGFHTVTSGKVTQGPAGVTTEPDGKFESENLATDATFEFTFEEPGSFPYFCAIHPATMSAVVTVK